MLPFKKILCPLDFSEPSYVALSRAIELCGHFGAPLVLIHVMETIPPPTPDMAFGYGELVETEQAAEVACLEKLKSRVKELVPIHIETFSNVRRGDPAEEIVSLAEKHEADLIVIATHGTTGWRHLVFGSVAEKVVQTARCAVLTVRRTDCAQQAPEKQPGKSEMVPNHACSVTP